MSPDPLDTLEAIAVIDEESDAVALPHVVPEPGRSLLGAWLRLLVAPGLVLAAFVGVWYLLSWGLLAPIVCRVGNIVECSADAAHLRSIILPYPHDVVDVALLDTESLTSLLSGLWLDVRLSFIGLAISMMIGILTAIAMSQAAWVERSFYPYAVFLQTVPILALVPVIGLFLGFGFSARLIVVVIISLFPIVTNTLFGLKSADQGLHDLFTLHTNSRWVRLRKLMLPASLPAMFTGFQISAGLSVIGAIVGDFFFGRGERGLGNLILIYSNRLRSEELWAAVFFSTALGLSVFIVFGWMRTRLTGHWHGSTRARRR